MTTAVVRSDVVRSRHCSSGQSLDRPKPVAVIHRKPLLFGRKSSTPLVAARFFEADANMGAHLLSLKVAGTLFCVQLHASTPLPLGGP